jgi:hypothetical protein
MVPRLNPLLPVSSSNPAVTASIINFTTWKNKLTGVIAQSIGDVRFINIKAADNLKACIEVSLTRETIEDNTAQINGALLIGES